MPRPIEPIPPPLPSDRLRVGDCLVVGRYALWRGMSASVAVALANGDGIARMRQWLLWNTKKPLKRFAGPVYRLLRHRMMAVRA